MTQATGAARFDLLQQCMYGPTFPEDYPELFPLLTEVGRGVPWLCLARPDSRWSVHEVADLIVSHAMVCSPLAR